MIRQYHRMQCMDNSKLAKKIFLWDRALNENDIIKTWSSEVQSIFEQTNQLAIYSSNNVFCLKTTVGDMTSSLKIKQQDYLTNECGFMPKLRTFNLFKDFQDQPAYITKPLTFHLRRMLARTRLGCLPLRVETGRYSVPRLPEHQRTCLVCRVPDQLVAINFNKEYLFIKDCVFLSVRSFFKIVLLTLIFFCHNPNHNSTQPQPWLG